MGKCFLGLWGGTLLGLDYFVSNAARYGEHWANALAGAAAWALAGGVLTVICLMGYALYEAAGAGKTR